MEKTRSSRGSVEDEEDEEEEFARKDGCACSHKGEIGKIDGKRSKHSATEQRRRSKINDRFQKLRDLIPNSSDQKRDKASFLLEVVEYIQFLQEKVHKYETALPGWNQGSMKLATWKHGQGPGGSTADHSQVIKNGPATGYMFDRKIDDSSISVSPSVLTNAQNLVESNSLNTVSPYKPMNHHLGFTGKGSPVPMSLQQNMYAASVGRSGGIAQPPQRLTSDTENMASQSQPQTWPRSYPTNNDMLSEQEELTIEGGTVRMSGVYSQGLLNSFSQALQNSGIDLSQASISVQIDIGKRAISRPSTTTSGAKDHEEPSAGNRAMVHSRVASNCEDSDQAQKRFKKDNS